MPGLSEIKGIGKVLEEKLKEAGITTVKDILEYEPEELAEMIDIPVARAKAIISLAKKHYIPVLTTLAERAKEFEDLKTITTGCSNLDKLLGGGFRQRFMYELVGPFASGKTQIVSQASVTVQLPEDKGGVNGKALIIDTEYTYLPSRIAKIAKRFELDPKKAWSNIFLLEPKDWQELLLMVENLDSAFENNPDIGLLAVDSIIEPFRKEFLSVNTLRERQAKLAEVLANLKKYSLKYKVPVIITNQVVSAPSSNPFLPLFDIERPTGGNIVAHTAQYRIYLRRAGGTDKRIARLIDAPDSSGYLEVPFRITDRGIEDVK